MSLDGLIDGTAIERQLGALAVSLHATLLVGVTETVSTQSFRNEIVAFAPSGKLVARFEKVHRVPFGEYIPYRGFFKHLANLSSVPLDAIPGHGNGVLHTPAGPLGTLVSYEVFYAERGLASPPAPGPSSSSTPPTPRPISPARCRPRRSPRPGSRPSPKGATSCRPPPPASAPSSTTAAGSWPAPISASGPSSSGTSSLRTGRTIYERVGDLPVLVVARPPRRGGMAGCPRGRRRSADAEPTRARHGAGDGPASSAGHRRRAPLRPAEPAVSLDRSSPWRAATICRMPSLQSTVGRTGELVHPRQVELHAVDGVLGRLEAGLEPGEIGEIRAPLLDAHRRAPTPVDHRGRHRRSLEEGRQHAGDVVLVRAGGRRSGRRCGPGSPIR